MTDAPRPHHIEIEVAVEQAIANLLDDPDGRDIEVERDDLLAIIYAWQQEQTVLADRAGREGADDLREKVRALAGEWEADGRGIEKIHADRLRALLDGEG